jgi:putative membrane protein
MSLTASIGVTGVRRFSRLLRVLLLLALLAFILLFTLENQQAVALVFLGFSFPQLPVSVLLLGGLLLGLMVGPAMGMLVVWQRGHKRRRVNAK